MRDHIRRGVLVTTLVAAILSTLAPAAGADERTWCVYVNDFTIICVDD